MNLRFTYWLMRKHNDPSAFSQGMITKTYSGFQAIILQDRWGYNVHEISGRKGSFQRTISWIRLIRPYSAAPFGEFWEKSDDSVSIHFGVECSLPCQAQNHIPFNIIWEIIMLMMIIVIVIIIVLFYHYCDDS